MRVFGVFNIQETRSFSAINLRQVEVTFNQAVDETTAKTAANYTANMGVNFSAPILSADKTKVTLFSSANLSKTVDTTVTVKDVKSADKSQTLASVSKTVKGIDNAIPSVTEVQVLGPQSIKVCFSEPVVNGDDVAAYSKVTAGVTTALAGPGDAAAYVTGTHNKEVIISLDAANALAIGQHTLIINDGAYTVTAIADCDGKPLQPRSVQLTVEEDLTIPAVESAEFVNQTTVKVTFNKPVNLSEGVDYSANFYWNTNGTAGFTQYPANASNTVEKVDAQTFNVKFTTNPIAAGAFYFFVTGVTDYNGVAIETSKTALTATADAGLSVTGINSAKDNEIKITFNREVTNATATNAANYTIKNAAGAVQAISGSPSRGGAGNNVVTITMASNLPGGTYTVEVKNIKDILNNTLADTTLTVAITDTTPISTFSVTAVSGAINDKIIVSYPEAMMTTGTNGIGTKVRYQYDVNGGGMTALGESDNVTVAADGKSATIIFSRNDIFAAGDAIDVTINLVADAAGNVIPDSINFKVDVNSNTAATAIDEATGGLDITSIIPQITGLQTVKFTVDRHLSAISGVDFLLNDGSTSFPVANATYTNSAVNNTSVIELTAGANLDLAKTWTVKTNTTIAATTDLAGVKIQANKTSQNAVNAIQPEFVKASVKDAKMKHKGTVLLCSN